ncbi:MAG: signal peptidase I, partial [Bacteroidota bacterium]
MKNRAKTLKDWIKAVLIAAAVVVSFVWLIGNWYMVSSGSMESTLNTGDMVFVNKTAYGARLPYTPLSLPFTDGHSGLIRFGYHRLPGYSSVKRGDIVAFNYPDLDTVGAIDHKSVWIKRVVALPGDTVRFIRSVAVVNNEPEQYVEALQ